MPAAANAPNNGSLERARLSIGGNSRLSRCRFQNIGRLHVRLHVPEVFELMQHLDIALVLELTRPFVYVSQ
jgi:hypothetical protein